jgi:energy-coupling factor transport system permease protein
MLAYIERPSPVQNLSGAIKLIVFLLWSVLSMLSYDPRILLALCLTGIVLFAVSKIRLREVSFIFKMLLLFMGFNLIGIYVFAPEQGVLIYESRHVLVQGLGRYTITAEQLFYEMNVLLKYLSIVPPAILLMVTTNPSEFAASLNRIGVSYTVAYAVSLTLRYIPDVQRDFTHINRAQQARGLELSKKTSPLKRLKGAARLLLPLIISSMERIEVVSHAMELRGFGKNRTRSWYMARPFNRFDLLVCGTALLLFALGIWFSFRSGSRFYSPWAGG